MPPWADVPCKTHNQTSSRYGMASLDGVQMGIHKKAWILANGPVPEGMCVLHHCDTPACYEVAHLFLGTLSDNSLDMVAKGRQRDQRGEKNASAVLTDEQVEEIRSRYTYGRGAALAREYGVNQSTISRIVHEKRRTHVSR